VISIWWIPGSGANQIWRTGSGQKMEEWNGESNKGDYFWAAFFKKVEHWTAF
jgi:hypothetical protein